MNWSESQQKAIKASGGTILVSAAAGSGKTAVIVERIIDKITEKKNNTNIDEILVVTFSNAAASEIKDRISNQINQLLIDNPGDIHLQTQQLLLDSADISTVHSFCQNVIKQNFQELSISLDFKIANQYQSDVLKFQAFSEIIDDFYEDPQFDNILKITDATYDITKLFKHVKNISDFLMAIPFYDDWLDEQLQSYQDIFVTGNIERSKFGGMIFKLSLELISQAQRLLKNAMDICYDFENHKVYLENLNVKLSFLNEVRASVDNFQWQETFDLLSNFKVESLPRAKKSDDVELVSKVKALHERFKEIVKILRADYFFVQKNEFISDINYIYLNLSLLFEIIKKFLDRYQQLKKLKNFLDFSDLEQLTIKLLYVKNQGGYQKSPIAENISNNYKEIFVDEYQDTNLTQEYIFKAVSRAESNLFMVGDSKQSIYRFRQAMPQLFVQKIGLYQNYQGDGDCDTGGCCSREDCENVEINSKFPAKIILNQNFRSNRCVTDFVNFVFEQLMSLDVGEVDYDDSQKLIPSLNNMESNNDNLTEICFLSAEKNCHVDWAKQKLYYEALFIAKKINNMVKTKFKVKKNSSLVDVDFRDFCVLMRSPNEKIGYFVKAFGDVGVPILTEGGSNFFESKEIYFLISLLKIINNPFDDVSMMAIMLSEFFVFSLDDILELQNYKAGSLFQAIKQDINNNGLKFEELYELILNLKRYVNILPLDKLLEEIYSRVDIYNIVKLSKNYGERVDNLALFVDMAKDFCDNGNNSLIDFIYYLNRLDEQKICFKLNNDVDNNENAVKIMSIHKAKGLEFPICVLADVSRQFNKVDTRSSVLYHNDFGVAINKFDSAKNLKYSTVPKNALKFKIENDILSEELRILYVALTRAKEKLIVVISDNDYQDRISDLSQMLSVDFDAKANKKISPYILKQAKSYEDFFILSLLRHPQMKKMINGVPVKFFLDNVPEVKIFFEQVFDGLGFEEQRLKTENMSVEKSVDICSSAPVFFDKNLIALMQKREDYRYPYQHLTRTPSKLGVSEIVKRDMLGGSCFDKKPQIFFKNNLSSAKLGNITHKFMQFANYENAKQNLDLECERLLKQEFISDEEYQNLNKIQLMKFFNSDLYSLISSAKIVHREIRFVYPISVSEFDNLSNVNRGKVFVESDDKVVIQGIADCVIENQNNIVIIDYKTDRIQTLDELYDKYSLQLMIYQRALTKMFHKDSDRAIIYSFYLNQYLDIK